MRKITMDSFMKRAKLVHGEKYDYSLVENPYSKVKVKIICPTHGLFEQSVGDHLSGAKCPKCSMMEVGVGKRTPKNEIFEQIKNLNHNHDYSKLEFTNKHDKVIIIDENNVEHKLVLREYLNGVALTFKSALNKTEFAISKFRKIHGDKYDYSKVEYVSSQTKIEIICPKHGSFFQVPNSHLNGNACPECGKLTPRSIKVKKKTTEEFIEKAREIHGDFYDYSLVEYVNSETRVKIICPIHGEFEQVAGTHLGGKSCKKCGRARTGAKQKSNLKDFTRKAKKVHSDKYDYSEGEYLGAEEKIYIICPEHGGFRQSVKEHLLGSKCPTCSGVHKLSTEEFIEKSISIFGDNYDYELTEYVNNRTDVFLKCKLHDLTIKINPQRHLKGYGCPECTKKEKVYNKTTEEFIEDAKLVHGEVYDYSLVNYRGSETKVEIICKKHQKSFFQKPYKHINGNGCPICRESNAEIKIRMFLGKNNIKYLPQHKFKGCKYKKPLSYDFYLVEENLCIEYDGIQHFQPIPRFGGEKAFIENQKRDGIKTNYCKDNKIKLLRIPYTEYNKIEEILEKYLKENT
jgi:Zn ribbon nucleic-acid-binding protein/very-short-patch-repair endonuclease